MGTVPMEDKDDETKNFPRYSVIMAIIAFIVAAIPAFGTVMKEDPVGRAIFAVVWVLIGIAWLGPFQKNSYPKFH